jgi:hypothetical protein
MDLSSGKTQDLFLWIKILVKIQNRAKKIYISPPINIEHPFHYTMKIGLGKHTYRKPKMEYLRIPQFPNSFYNMDIVQTLVANKPNNHVR